MDSTHRSLKIFTILVCAFISLIAMGEENADKNPKSPASEQTQKSDSGQENELAIQAAKEALSKWVETRQIISKEKKDWLQMKDILVSRIDLLKKEVEQLKMRIEETQNNASDAEKRKEELTQQSEALKASISSLGEVIMTFEKRIRHIYQSLPDPLKEKLSALYLRIPEDSNQTKVSLAERFQNIIGIANEVSKLNNEITTAMEIRSLSDGKPAEVKTIYVGLAQGYFISAKGEAGVGYPSDQGWKWQTANELWGNINQAIEIIQNKGSPKFIPLPVKIN